MKIYCDHRTPSGVLMNFISKEFDLAFEFHQVDLLTGQNYEPEFLAINPSGKTPVLFDGDFKLTENASILRYICERYDKPGYPRELHARIRVDERLDFIGSQFFYHIINKLLILQIAPQVKFGISHEQVPEAMIDFLLHRGRLYMQLINDEWLGGRHPYLTGDTLSIADYLFAAMMTIFDIWDISLKNYPHIEAWKQQVFSLPNFQSSWDSVKAELMLVARAAGGEAPPSIKPL